MTTYLERTPAAAAYYDDTPTVPFEIPTVVETTDGCTAGQRLNATVKALVEEARDSELPSDGDTFLLGDIHGQHIAFSQEIITPENGPTVEVSRLEVVAPLDNLHYYYHCAKVSAGSHAAFDFSVHEENDAGVQEARFVGSTDTEKPAELSGVAAELSTQLAETLIDVVSSQNQGGSLSTEALHEIVAPLTSSPEVAPQRSWQRIYGKAALFLSRFSSKHAAA